MPAEPRSGRRVALLARYPAHDPASPGEFIPNYGVRMVEASLRASGLDGLEVEVFDLRDADVEEFVSRVESMDADVVGFSTYLWSFPTFVEVARRLKAKASDRLIVFGGPSARPSMLSLEAFRDTGTFVDALVLGEGEQTFVDIVRAGDRGTDSLRNIPGLALWQPHGWEPTAPRPLVEDLDTLPSPYRLGLIRSGGLGIMHHYRGCPFKCSFCEWGPLENPKRVLSVDAISAELEAMAAADVDGVLCVDAGLNINAQAFENLSAAIRRTGVLANRTFDCDVYPAQITKRHLQFFESLERASVGVGLQAWDNKVLAHVDRSYDEKHLVERVHQLAAVAHVSIELIVGLPGDNIESFKRTFELVRNLPVAVRVYHCVVLPSALMVRAPAHFAMNFDPYTLKMNACLGWPEDDLAEVCRFLADASAREGYAGDYLWLFPSPGTPAQLAADATGIGSGEANMLASPRASEAGLISPNGGETEIERGVTGDPGSSQEAVEPVRTGESEGTPLPPRVHNVIALAVAQASSGAWELKESLRQPDRVLLRIRSGSADPIVVEIRRALGPDVKAFRVLDSVAYSYLDHGLAMSETDLRHLGAVAQKLRRVAVRLTA